MRTYFALLALASALVATGAAAMTVERGPIQLSPEAFQHWMHSGGHPLMGTETVPEVRQKVLKRVRDDATGFLLGQGASLHTLGWFGRQVSDTLSRLLSPSAQAARRALQDVPVDQTPVTARAEALQQVLTSLRRRRAAGGLASAGANDNFRPFGLEKYPYFRFIPSFEGKLIPDGEELTLRSPCFTATRVRATTRSDGVVAVDFDVQSASSLLCVDFYMLATPSGVWPISFFFRGQHRVEWQLPQHMTDAQRWDLAHNGIRLFRFLDDPVQIIVDVLDTVSLFIPALTEAGIRPEVATRNRYFMEHYAGFKLSSRTAGVVDVDESLIHSGDLFAILRLDGLDPMLAWAMGSTTGHVTAALRIDGELYVVESTTKDSYWPTNGIQATPYREWLQLVRRCRVPRACSPHTAAHSPPVACRLNARGTTSCGPRCQRSDAPCSTSRRRWSSSSAPRGLTMATATCCMGGSTRSRCAPGTQRRGCCAGGAELIMCVCVYAAFARAGQLPLPALRAHDLPGVGARGGACLRCVPQPCDAHRACRQILFGAMHRLAPEFADMLFGQALNLRLGTSGLAPEALFQEAVSRGVEPRSIPMLVESDDYVYNTTRYGKVRTRARAALRRPGVPALMCARAAPAGHRQVHGVLRVCVQHLEGGRPVP